MKATHVVAAIIKKNNHYLIAKRNRDKYMGLMWEFPGGKVEESETFEEALSREIIEELNVSITIHNKIADCCPCCCPNCQRSISGYDIRKVPHPNRVAMELSGSIVARCNQLDSSQVAGA